MSVANKLTLIAENQPQIYNAGYEAGKSEGDDNIAAFIDRSLTKIEIPRGVTRIGPGAFQGCGKVTGTVTVPEGVTRIEYNAFTSCSAVTELKLPDSLEYIGTGGVADMTSLERLVLPSKVVGFPSTMAARSKFTEFVAEGDVKSVGPAAFQQCTECLSYDFTHCTSVPPLNNTNAFNGINPDAKILVPAPLYDEWIVATNWAAYADHIVGVAPLEYALDPDGTAYTVTGIGTYDSVGNLTDLIIPEKHEGLPVISIAPSAFEGNSTIGHVTIPESVTSIGASAFADCTELTRIYFGAADIPDLDYGKGVFKCAGKNGDGISVVIGNKVKRLPAYTFDGGAWADGVAKVKTVEFEEGSVCTEIGDWAFYYCMKLESFVAPATLEKLGSWALFTVNTVDVLDFSACTQIPTLSQSDDLMASTIYVPAARYAEWIVTTNWAAYANKIIAK